MGKKGKKSKKQLEDELSKQQEEQKREEDKERLQKLEEDAWETQQQRYKDELEATRRVEEAERLEQESTIVSDMKGERKRDLEYEQRKLQDQIDWEKFISCTSRPDVAFENQITTYINTCRQEKLQKIEEALQKCHESEEIVGDLMELYCKAREESDVARQDWCLHYIHEIRTMEIDQMDAATAHLLQYIEEQEANSHSQVYLTWGNAPDRIKVGFWGHLLSKGFRAKAIDHHKIQVNLELPKSIALQSMGHCIGVRTLYTAFDGFRGKDPSQMSIGGVIRVDLLSIPPFSRQVKTWRIRQVPPPGQELMRLAYPNTEHAGTTTTAGALQPCKIEYKVPEKVVMQKNPTISYWDANAEKWSTDSITDIAWEPETRKISFYSQRLAAFSITQERHCDLPYQWWSIRPIAPLLAELTVQAPRAELHFEISADGLRLKGPEYPELAGLMFLEHAPQPGPGGGVGPDGLAPPPQESRTPRVLSPATLLVELRDCGINLLPEDSDAAYLGGITPKDVETQRRAYSDLSELAASHDIVSSAHNKWLPPGRAAVRLRENLHFEEYDPLDPDCESDYRGVMFYPDKACFVQSLEGEAGENKGPSAPQEGHVTHASLYLCFDRQAEKNPEQLKRLEVNCSNARFVEAVRQTMQLMRLLCFV